MSDAFSTDDFDSLGQRGAQKKRASGEKAGANGEKIREGGRHHFLVSMAGTLRKRGLSLAAIEAALLEINLTMCEPPQDEADVRRIARDMGAKPAGDGVNRSPPSDSGESESSREDRLRRLLVGFTAADAFDETGRAKPPPERAYAVEHLLPLGVHGLVVGPGGLGKGLAEVAFADHIARGVPIPACRWRDGGVPEAVSLKIGERRGVLLVCKEDDRDELLRRIIAYRALRAGDDWQGSIDSAERALLARNLHLIALPAPVEMDRLFVRLIAERARHLDGPAWIALDPLGRFLFRDSDGRVLRFIEGEYAVLVSDLCAELAERTGACVSPVHHMRRAARQALHEGGEAAEIHAHHRCGGDRCGVRLLLQYAPDKGHDRGNASGDTPGRGQRADPAAGIQPEETGDRNPDGSEGGGGPLLSEGRDIDCPHRRRRHPGVDGGRRTDGDRGPGER